MELIIMSILDRLSGKSYPMHYAACKTDFCSARSLTRSISFPYGWVDGLIVDFAASRANSMLRPMKLATRLQLALRAKEF